MNSFDDADEEERDRKVRSSVLEGFYTQFMALGCYCFFSYFQASTEIYAIS